MAEIRNCTMNFSADVIFALRQLVCTEVHRKLVSILHMREH